jgi:hypothetical protein
VGILNGYASKEGGLPTNIKYGTMGLTTGVYALKVLGDTSALTTRPVILATTLFVTVPALAGTTFCLGGYVGRWQIINAMSNSNIKNCS